jgi:serine/threonine protein kinase/tetratricopeptide (TPR) repeat protein
MAAERTCPKCGTGLSSDALEGLCPKCVGRAAFDNLAHTGIPESREEAIVNAALELSDRAEREELVNAECQDDIALSARVRRLLATQQRRDALPEGEASVPPELAAELARLKPEEAGERIGRYKLLEQIGEGGFGVVWVAEQSEPVRRRVALKIIKMGMDTKEVITRFEQERQALAMMDHPNIARVLDAGATQYGRPFFVMELVRGLKITEYCDREKLSTGERLGLFIQVCEAVQHAHQKGIIHRDLKPSNILVTVNDGAPVPKVIDFGVAKATQGRLTEHTVYTQFQQMIGTPLYMSPEQAEMTSLDIDTRSDIYSLGVLLYELLTGRTPIDHETLARVGMDEVRRVIREVDPPRPSTRVKTLQGEALTSTARRRQIDPGKLPSALRGDLDWIVMKAIEKNRTRRYETANAFAMDVRRHLQSEAVLARPPSNLYRFQKLVRRNRLAFAAAGMVSAALIVGLAVSTWLFFKEKAARARAVASEQAQGQLRLQAEAGERKAATEATKSQQVAEFLQDMLKGIDPDLAKGRDTSVLRGILDKAAQDVGEKLKDHPEVEAELRGTIGRVYYTLGDYAKAGDQQSEALKLQRKIHGEISVEVAKALQDLADTLRERGDLAGAEVNSRARLELWKKLEVPAGPQVALALNDLGLDLWSRGDLAGAKPFLRQVLDERRRLPGDQRLEISESLSNVGLVLWDGGEFEEAEAMQRNALDLRRAVLGENTAVAQSLHNLALVLRDRGALERSEELFGEALGLMKKLVGEAHPRTAWVSSHLAGVLRRRAGLSGDVALLRRALQLNPTDPLTADSLACILAKPALLPLIPEEQRAAASWHYSYNSPPPDWTGVDFRDDWVSAPALSSASTYAPRSHRVAPRLKDVWLRREFELAEVPKGKLAFLVNRDEDAEVFLNGIQAAAAADWTDAEVLLPCSERGSAALRQGRNMLAIHCQDADGDTRIGVEMYVLQDPDLGRQQLIGEFNRMIQEEPQRGELHAGSANAWARLGKWQEAAGDLSRAIELKPLDDMFSYQLAPLLIEMGNLHGYQMRRQTALIQFAKPNSPDIAARIAMLALLTPAKDSELASAVKLADVAAAVEHPDGGLAWRQITKGLAEYRLGEFASAIDWMNKALLTGARNDLPGWNHERERNRLVVTNLVMAMAYHRIGKTDQARGALGKAIVIMQTQFPRSNSGDIGREWTDWLIANILRGETEMLIGG